MASHLCGKVFLVHASVHVWPVRTFDCWSTQGQLNHFPNIRWVFAKEDTFPWFMEHMIFLYMVHLSFKFLLLLWSSTLLLLSPVNAAPRKHVFVTSQWSGDHASSVASSSKKVSGVLRGFKTENILDTSHFLWVWPPKKKKFSNNFFQKKKFPNFFKTLVLRARKIGQGERV